MPDERFLHPRLGHSEKVTALTDLQFRVWVTYVLAADDFGVLRASSVTLQSKDDALAVKTARVITKCITKIISLGLVETFEHQGRQYLCQLDWQDHQHIRYPRPSSHPTPPPLVISRCTEKTQALFRMKTKTAAAEDRPDRPEALTTPISEKVSERSRIPARAGGREWLPANSLLVVPNPDRARASTDEPESAVGDPTLADRAGRFLEKYAELFHEHRKGARYLSKPALDFPEAVRLCRTWDDDRLFRLVTAFFLTNDKFCREGSGSVAHFASRASWCDARLKEKGF